MFTITERVRWSDVDDASILYFGNYIRFYEIAETEWLRTYNMAYSQQTFDRWGVYPVRRVFHCEYEQPAVLDDLLRIELWTEHIGTTSYKLGFAVRRDQSAELLAKGYCVMVTVDIQTRKPVPIPTVLRQALEENRQIMDHSPELIAARRTSPMSEPSVDSEQPGI